MSRDNRFQLFLGALSAIAFALILLATSKYGAGVSSDAARNLSTADSLLSGKGFVDMLGAPLILWPPLYPLALAGLSALTHFSTFQSGWYLNIFLYVINIWFAGWFLYLIFRERPLLAAAGALALLLSRSTLRIHANVASEPLFETLCLVYFVAAAGYLRRASRVALWIMFAAAGLAALQRYLGVCLIAVGALVVISQARTRTLRPAVIPFFAALLPITLWTALHNYPVSGTPFGPRDLGAMLPLDNVSLSLTKILWWFIPRLSFLDPLLLRPWILVLGLGVILILLNKKADWLRWAKSLTSVHVWPALVFSVLYFLLLAFTVVTADHLDLTSDRYYVVIFPVVVALVLMTLDELVLVHFKGARRPVWLLVGGIALLWFAYPVYSVKGYLDRAAVQGEPTNYNVANSANFREMSVVKAAQKILDKDRSALVYSNYVNVVWFIYHHPVEELPFENASLPRAQRLTALQQNYPEWPRESGYIVWFIPNQYHHIAAPSELIGIADLKLLYADETGQIYYVAASIH